MTAPRGQFLSAAAFDRLGDRRGDPAWLERAAERGRYVAVWQRQVLVSAGEPPVPALLPAGILTNHAADAERVLLGSRDGLPCFALGIPGGEVPALPGRFEDLRRLGDRLAPDDAALLAYARAMIGWHERHLHCAACGAPSASIEAGHARRCTRCEAKHFPRVDPAIIVLVADETRCLLGRQPSWPPGRYSTIAGFVEPGESLEDAVRREVREETGVEVAEVSYHGSQPWPFPSSLMLGFTAWPASRAIACRDGELEDARWVDREDITAGRILLPPRVSIAYRLIESWFDAAPGRSLAAEAEPGPWIARPES
jgi:NAD+ diphosphatase